MKIQPLEAFFNLLYPDLCIICNDTLNKNEKQICLQCINKIPRTHFHLQSDNPIEKRFWGKVSVNKATAFFYFHKGSPFQKLLHELKYKGNKEIGIEIGKHAAVDLLESVDFKSVETIIPVPLHPTKFLKRGYNQSKCIADGLAQILEVSVNEKVLSRAKYTETQTKKNVFERYLNTSGIFELTDNECLEDKHILLVDDVLTTGSTLEACIKALSEIKGIKISVFVLAVA